MEHGHPTIHNPSCYQDCGGGTICTTPLLFLPKALAHRVHIQKRATCGVAQPNTSEIPAGWQRENEQKVIALTKILCAVVV